MVNETTTKIVASRLCKKPEELDQKTLAKAVRSYQNADKEYWNALANSGQLDGNVPKYSMIAICYAWLAGDYS